MGSLRYKFISRDVMISAAASHFGALSIIPLWFCQFNFILTNIQLNSNNTSAASQYNT